MSRIISGLAGSIRLKSAAKATRPTSDRVKESLFAKLESMGAIEGTRVLDLYAGTGALGLEAASRGAAEVVLVESDKAASDVIKANIQLAKRSIGDACRISVERSDVGRYLSAEKISVDLVFIDPPYELSNTRVEEVLELLHPILSTKGLVVIERSSREDEIDFITPWKLGEVKFYGDTALYFVRAEKD